MSIAKLERLLKPVTRSTSLPPIVLTVRAVGRVNSAAISHVCGCEYGGHGHELQVHMLHNPWDGLLSLTSPNGRKWLCIAQAHSWEDEREIIDHEPTIELRGQMCGFDVIEIVPKAKLTNAPGVMFICESADDPKSKGRTLAQPVQTRRRKSSAHEADSMWAVLDPDRMNS